VGRLAVQTGSWIVYEVENGVYKLSTPSLPFVNKERRKPIDLYLKAQGRFAKMTEEEKARFVAAIDENWNSAANSLKIGRLFSSR
jgi:pyruvate ferredoxin oxidoreductase beta subunit